MTTQGRLFEGYVVEAQQATITFDIEEEDLKDFVVDRPIVFAGLAIVDVPSFSRTKDGGLKRKNKLKAHVVRIAHAEMRDELLEFYNLAIPGEGFFFPAEVGKKSEVPDADPVTGEVRSSGPEPEGDEDEGGYGDEDYPHDQGQPEQDPNYGSAMNRDPALAAWARN